MPPKDTGQQELMEQKSDCWAWQRPTLPRESGCHCLIRVSNCAENLNGWDKISPKFDRSWDSLDDNIFTFFFLWHKLVVSKTQLLHLEGDATMCMRGDGCFMSHFSFISCLPSPSGLLSQLITPCWAGPTKSLSVRKRCAL